MDFSRIEECGILNLHPVFGRGLRGETLTASRNKKWFGLVVQIGIRRIIDLRTADHNDKLMADCQRGGVEYYHFPIDSHVQDPQTIARTLPELFRLLDEDGFYISCQQGLHRTDIAMALYYFFRDDKEVPVMFGHIRKGQLRCDDIMRRIKSIRTFFDNGAERDFEERRRRFLRFNRELACQNETGQQPIHIQGEGE